MTMILALVRRGWQRPHWFVEVYSALTLVGWAVSNAVAATDFSPLDGFQLAMRMFSSAGLELLVGTIGLCQLAGCIIDKPLSRFIGAFLASFMCSLISLSFICAPMFPPNTALAIAFVVINVFAIIRAFKGIP